MGSQALTNLLTIMLIVSVVILFILVIVFVCITLKRKQEEKKENDSKKKKEPEKPSNVVVAKEYTTENIKNFMDFDEIKDNMIIQKKGKKMVMVVQCQGINYDLMSSMEKVGVEQGFIQFLNTLTRPIQIYVQTRKVNLGESIKNYNKRLKNIESAYKKAKIQFEHIENSMDTKSDTYNKIKLEYVRQKNLYEYTKDIIANTEKLSLNKNILTKKYYIAISYYPENPDGLFKKEEMIDMAFSELYTNAQSVLRGLAASGITGKVLNSEELADLLFVAYNRDESEIIGVDKAIKSGYDALYTSTQDVIDKRIKELDKVINEKALKLANDTIEQTTIESKRRKELELKEKSMDELIRKIAKDLIEENRNYIPKEIADESVKAIDEGKKAKKQEKGA